MGEELVTALVVLCEVFSSWSLVHSFFYFSVIEKSSVVLSLISTIVKVHRRGVLGESVAFVHRKCQHCALIFF